ncbi:uncharacterized protein LOC116287568 isoform X1 [Actinia tenebrosa]|uniref:Uncharacterized protein LOC116287568 isoform X1 n=1 Tax=Actinia tenebrosa TaxID=6105 RepID=A0A6P8H3C8_ACTTE|nr:uncharacterized protein LOC116287568 isoform X1 [Actinia tenebrosa]
MQSILWPALGVRFVWLNNRFGLPVDNKITQQKMMAGTKESIEGKARSGKSSIEVMFTSLAEVEDSADTISEDISSELDAYHEAYRNGNFGVRRGRMNFTRAKRWSIAHFLTAAIMTCFTAACIQLLDNNEYGVDSQSAYGFSAVAILCDICGLVMACCSIYLLGSIATTPRPLLVLFAVRLIAVLECTLVGVGIILTIKVINDTREDGTEPTEHNRRYGGGNFTTFIILCIYLLISMVVDVITALAWLFHWWRCCVCCQCLKSCCIFEPGEPLAPGVRDPPTGFLRECAYVCWLINRKIGL